MNKLILIVSTIFVIHINALDISKIVVEINNNQSYRESCLDLLYSNEFCKFSASFGVLLLDMAKMNANNTSDEIINKYMQRIMGKYVCPNYRDMANVEKNMLDELYFGDIPVDMTKEDFDSMCY